VPVTFTVYGVVPDANVMFTVVVLGPAKVSQLRVIEAGPTIVAVACSVPVQMTSARIARSTFRKRIWDM